LDRAPARPAESEHPVAMIEIGRDVENAGSARNRLLVVELQSGLARILGRAEDIGAAAADAGHNVLDRFVKGMCRVIGLDQFGRPARAGTLEDDGDFLLLFLEFIGEEQGVEEAAQRFIGTGLGIGIDNDGGFGHWVLHLVLRIITERTVNLKYVLDRWPSRYYTDHSVNLEIHCDGPQGDD